MTGDDQPSTGCPPAPGMPRLRATGAPVPPSHPGPPPGGEWPLYSHMAYGPLVSTVPTARARTKVVLREWGAIPDDLTADVLTVVSELTSNAVQASLALPLPRPVRVWMCCDWVRVLVQVGDESHAQPVWTPPSGDSLTGRGLLIVAGLSDSWGWFPASGHGLTKVVWSEMRVPPAVGAPRLRAGGEAS
jgi:anti-sigma regulatory factor (Ser/Thr protein kinase)